MRTILTSPARKGELLIAMAKGLGPTRPGVVPGVPFPPVRDGLQEVDLPVQVDIAGQSTPVINAVGWPGMVATYRINFYIPDAAPSGGAALQLTAGWFAGMEYTIPIR